MAVAFVAQSLASATLGGDPVVNVPTGTTSGQNQIMLAWGATTGAQTITAHADWTTHPQSIGATRPLFYRIVTGSEPATYTFVTSGAANAVVGIATYSGVDTSNPFAGNAGSVATTSTTVTVGATTPSVAAYLAQVLAKLNTNTWTPPAVAAPEDWDNATAVASTGGGHDLVAGGVSTGTRVWLASAGANSGVGYAVPLRAGVTNLSVSGFDVAVTFGAVTLVQDQFVSVTGFDVDVQFGTPPTLIPDQSVSPTGFDVAVAFGVPSLAQDVQPVGFDLTVVFGTPVLRQSVPVDGFDLTVQFGTPGISHVVQPDGLDLLVEFGTPNIVTGSVLNVTGFDVTIDFGTPSVSTELTISGTVFNHETGTAVAGAVVRLFDDNDVKVEQVTSGVDGSFLFLLGFNPTDTYYTTATWDDAGTQYTGASDRGCEPS